MGDGNVQGKAEAAHTALMPWCLCPIKLASCIAGETAGLRVPRAGLNQHKQPMWMCHGCLFRSARPELSDIGGEAREEGPAPVDRCAVVCCAVLCFAVLWCNALCGAVLFFPV